jgi:flavin reductase (DIM6/NTAB) family NADH-FMN oxidoreductase RutF
MFYETTNGHGLPHDPFKAIIAPRPIGWISTISKNGVPNLAPYSFFNAVSASPPILAFSSEGLKDSVSNAQETREFVFNLVSMDLLNQMNLTSSAVPHEYSEFGLAGLEEAPSQMIKPPRVLRAAASLECKVIQVIQLADLDKKQLDRYLVLGQVVGVHIDDQFLVDGKFMTSAAKPVARCGYQSYTLVESTFDLKRPD